MDILYIDVKKAFDTVSHQKLLYKLEKMGVGGNMMIWFNKFMCERTQCVRVNNVETDVSPVISGTGQGTILGSLLFLLFISDISNEINNGSKITLYADDAKLYNIQAVKKHAPQLK